MGSALAIIAIVVIAAAITTGILAFRQASTETGGTGPTGFVDVFNKCLTGAYSSFPQTGATGITCDFTIGKEIKRRISPTAVNCPLFKEYDNPLCTCTGICVGPSDLCIGPVKLRRFFVGGGPGEQCSDFCLADKNFFDDSCATGCDENCQLVLGECSEINPVSQDATVISKPGKTCTGACLGVPFLFNEECLLPICDNTCNALTERFKTDPKDGIRRCKSGSIPSFCNLPFTQSSSLAPNLRIRVKLTTRFMGSQNPPKFLAIKFNGESASTSRVGFFTEIVSSDNLWILDSTSKRIRNEILLARGENRALQFHGETQAIGFGDAVDHDHTYNITVPVAGQGVQINMPFFDPRNIGSDTFSDLVLHTGLPIQDPDPNHFLWYTITVNDVSFIGP